MKGTMPEKVIRDGKVAVLVSHGFGAGWSSWGRSSAPAEELMFDSELVALIEKRDAIRAKHEDEALWEVAKKAAVDYCLKRWPDVYTGGVGGLSVEWVPVGRRFRINEYDGSETLVLDDEDDWVTA